LAVASANVFGGVDVISHLHAFLAYLSSLSIFQYIGLAAAVAAVAWSIWWAVEPDN